MSILGNFKNYVDDDDRPQGGFKVPEVAKKAKEDLPIEKCMVLSTILHPTVVAVILVICFIAMLLGVKFSVFDRANTKPKDIEFVLVDKEAMPINKNTKYRADRNSRAGGKHDPKKRVSMPSASTKKSPTVAPKASSQSKVMKQLQQKAVKKAASAPVKHTPTPAPQQKTTQPPKVVKPTATPSYAPPTAPKVSASQKAPIGLPAPPSYTPGKYSNSTGPVGGTSSGSRASSSSGGGSNYGKTLGSAGSTGSRSGSGSAGNPGPGNPNGPFGIDALKEPNFAPYMRELQSRIKYNWDPPKGNESKRVVLMFRIAKNGQLLSNRVSKSSGLPAADRAALNAVQLTAPFRPLPVEFKGQYIDIQFTFDYNVFGATGY